MFSARKNQETRPAKTEARSETSWRTPRVDIYESEKGWKVLADLPGVVADGLHVQVDGGRLTLEASDKHSGIGWRRAFTLPDGVNGDSVQAKLENGVLAVDLARPTKDVPRRIEVKVG